MLVGLTGAQPRMVSTARMLSTTPITWRAVGGPGASGSLWSPARFTGSARMAPGAHQAARTWPLANRMTDESAHTGARL